MGASLKWRFAGVFLLTFALMIGIWWQFDVAPRYRGWALAVARLVSPLVTGWRLEYDRPGLIDPVVFQSGAEQLPMLVQLPALSMGLMPFVSLVVATPGLGWRRRTAAVVLGSFAYFLIHVLVVVTYPWIMHDPNAVKDTFGVFTGLVAFVVAPLALWFVLTYPALRALWHLGTEPAEK